MRDPYTFLILFQHAECHKEGSLPCQRYWLTKQKGRRDTEGQPKTVRILELQTSCTSSHGHRHGHVIADMLSQSRSAQSCAIQEQTIRISKSQNLRELQFYITVFLSTTKHDL